MHLFGDNGIIKNAQTASVMSKFASYKEEFGMNVMDDNGVYASGENLKLYIPSIEDKDLDKFVAIKSILMYIGGDETESKVASSLGLGAGSVDSSDATAAITEIHAIIDNVIVVNDELKNKVPTDDSQLLDEPEHKNTSEGLIGTRLFDRNALNMSNHTWNILDEYNSLNEKTARYGSGYYWLKKGETYVINGESINFKNDYVVDYSKNEYTILSGRAVNWNENATLAVTDGLALNVDPMSLADGDWRQNSEDSSFYDFYVKNTITEEWSNTGVQKTGDVEYDSSTKSLKFNENLMNTAGEGGYLKLMKSGVSFSNGFTFEMNANLSRLLVQESSDNNSSRHWASGLFCRIPYLGANYRDAMRFGFTQENLGNYYVAKFYEPRPQASSYPYANETFYTSGHGSINPVNKDPGYEVGKDFYLTCVYIVYDDTKTSELYDDYMKTNKIDKVEYYIDGNLLYYTYYPSDWYEGGLSTWNNDACPFFLGVCPWYTNNSLFFLKGNVYATRLYTKSFSQIEVKDNYDMTLKYRSSF